MKLFEAMSPVTRPLVGLFLSTTKHIDGLVMDPPGADSGNVEALAREVYHRHLAYLLVNRLYFLQNWYILGIAILVAIPMIFTSPIVLPLPVMLGLTVALLPIFWLAELAVVRHVSSRYARDDIAQARGLITRAFLRPVPANCPADLRDVWRWHWVGGDGRPLAADLTELDARWSISASVTESRVQLALLFVVPAWTGYGDIVAAIIGTILAVIIAFVALSAAMPGDSASAPPVVKIGPAELRRMVLDDGASATAESAAWVAAGGSAWAKRLEKARGAQIENACADPSPMIELGTASGVLAGRGDPFAPSPGLPVSMSLRDLCQHLLVTGGTGSGKTSFLRGIIEQVAGFDQCGLLVMDGKGALGAEVAAVVPNLTIIDPQRIRVSLVEGVTPAQLAEVVQERLGANSSDRFWIDSAASLLRQGAVLAHRANRYSLATAYRACIMEDVRAELLDRITPAADDLELDAARVFFDAEWPSTDLKTRSGIVSTLRSVYQQLASGNDLLRWAECEAGAGQADVTDVLRGGRVAIVAPAYRYGAAGPLVTSLLKMRLYNEVKARADHGLGKGETPFVLVADEFQTIALKGKDSDMAAIGRALGVAMALATQTVEGLEASLGSEDSAALLQVLGSMIALGGRSPKTDEMIAKRLGGAFRPTLAQMPGVPTTRGAIMVQAAAGARAAARHASDIADAISWDARGVAADLERRRGFGALQFAHEELKRLGGDDKHRANELVALTPICSIGSPLLVEPLEVGELVAVPASALVAITRGRVARRDVIDLRVRYS